MLLLLGCGCLLLLWPRDRVSGDTPGCLSNPPAAAELPLGLCDSSGAQLSLLPCLERFGRGGLGFDVPNPGARTGDACLLGNVGSAGWQGEDMSALHRMLTSMPKWKGMGKEELQSHFFPPHPPPHNNLFLAVFFLRAATSSLPLPSLLCRFPEDRGPAVAGTEGPAR